MGRFIHFALVLFLWAFPPAILLLTAAPAALAEPVELDFEPVLLNSEAPYEKTVGGLKYRGGLVLQSETDAFGGLSALLVGKDGKRLIALGDRGRRFEAGIAYDAKGNLSGLYDASLVRLTGTDGNPLSGKSSSDAESLAWDRGDRDGGVIAAFERRHRLLRYRAGRAKAEGLAPPPEILLAPRNGGIESLTRLADGRLVAISEDLATKGGVFGWVEARKGWSTFIYETDGLFVPKGAATLPGGDVLVLERFYIDKENQGARLMRLGPSAFVPGARIKGAPVADLRPPLTIDNFEGVAVAEGRRGETLIYLISDDNFSPRQRTLLMMFELVK